MMSDDRIDFSTLDPLADKARFERSVRAVMAGVRLEPAPHPLLVEIFSFGRRAVLAAGVAATAVWLLVFMAARPTTGSGAAGLSRDPVAQISEWAEAGRIPDGVDVLQIVGVHNVR